MNSGLLFTQHEDAPEHDTNNHGHHPELTYDVATRFEPSVEVSEEDKPEDDSNNL